MIVIGILAAIALPNYYNNVNNANFQTATNNLEIIANAQKDFYFKHGYYCINSSSAIALCGQDIGHLNANLNLNIPDKTYTYFCDVPVLGQSTAPFVCTAADYSNPNVTQQKICDPIVPNCQTDCKPVCVNPTCGQYDGCGGICPTGSCASGSICNNGRCVACIANCNDGLCHDTAYNDSNGCGTNNCPATCSSPNSCVSGKCVLCSKNCKGKNCGDDGCGGSCGTCSGSTPQCNLSGQCVCKPNCPAGYCGPNGCGVACGGCAKGEDCTSSGQCCLSDCTNVPCNQSNICGDSCSYICKRPQVCNNSTGTCCTPQCTGKSCGPDSCGGYCGGCPKSYICSLTGQCVPCTPQCNGTQCGNDDTCGGKCGCNSPQVCNSGTCCTPQCAGKKCGSDGCGGSCGNCPGAGNEYCDNNGQCICVTVCTSMSAVCGPDGCGSSCGPYNYSCPNGGTCNASGQCIACVKNCSDGLCHDTAYNDLNGCGTNNCPATCISPNSCVSGQCAICTQNCNDGQCHSTSYSYCGQTCAPNCVNCVSGQCLQSVCQANCADGTCHPSSYNDLGGCGTNDCPPNCTSPDSCVNGFCTAGAASTCIPNCKNAKCGDPDGCGVNDIYKGKCPTGTCPTGSCVNGNCV